MLISNYAPITLVSLTWFLLSCSEGGAPSLRPEPSSLSGINDRSQRQDPSVMLLKLPHAPALSFAEGDQGTYKVKSEIIEAIDAEQQQLIARLASISDEIQVLFKYRMVSNAISVLAPYQYLEVLQKIPQVIAMEMSGGFERPVHLDDEVVQKPPLHLDRLNSVTHVNAHLVHQQLKIEKEGSEIPVRGQGVRVGVIDSGIDYTHAMFGGDGNVDTHKSIDPDKEAPAGLFPNIKVVGGIDLTGSTYDASSVDFEKRIPKVDNNPMDEGGHGSHVAGSIAGIGDNINTYDGVAPGALLYAIKVFGKGGSSSTAVILAGLEYSADPNQDGQIDDRLDVINLSLGSPFGRPSSLYSDAIDQLTSVGMVVVASAGNSGHAPYIVGNPGSSDRAISVAASIDGMEHNYSFDALRFSSGVFDEAMLVEMIEGAINKTVKDFEQVDELEILPIGTAHEDLSDDVKAELEGKVALIDRGLVSFVDKLRRAAEAGAVAVVMVNNAAGQEPIVMGGEGKVDIPAVMITKEAGDAIKKAHQDSGVTVHFKSGEKVKKTWLIDTLTGFSSRGPRSLDALLKPELAAPGAMIYSAQAGGGDKSVPKSGTSMSAPHVAGAAALLKQYRPDLGVNQIKSMLVNQSQVMDRQGERYPISMQGAGRMDVFKAATASLVVEPPTVSLGYTLLQSKKSWPIELTITNVSKEQLKVSLDTSELNRHLKLVGPVSHELAKGESKVLRYIVQASWPAGAHASVELDGFIKFTSGETSLARVPVLAVARHVTNMRLSQARVYASSEFEAPGAMAKFSIQNPSNAQGRAEVFHLMGRDQRLLAEEGMPLATCDLESVGYRIRKVSGAEVVDFAFKLHRPVTSWDLCELSVQLDADGDGVADQELIGRSQDGQDTISVLYDAQKLREIRSEFDNQMDIDQPRQPEFAPAQIVAMPANAMRHASLAIISAPLSSLALGPQRMARVKVAVLGNPEAPGADDFLAEHDAEWQAISLLPEDLVFAEVPVGLTVAAGITESFDLVVSGMGPGLVVYFPDNLAHFGQMGQDRQSVFPEFEYRP